MLRLNELAWFSLNAVLMASLLTMSAALPPAPQTSSTTHPESATSPSITAEVQRPSSAASVSAPASGTSTYPTPQTKPSIPRIRGGDGFEDDD